MQSYMEDLRERDSDNKKQRVQDDTNFTNLCCIMFLKQHYSFTYHIKLIHGLCRRAFLHRQAINGRDTENVKIVIFVSMLWFSVKKICIHSMVTMKQNQQLKSPQYQVLL